MTLTVTGALAAECNRLREENRRLREEVAEARRIADHDKALWLAAEAALATARAETGALIERATARVMDARMGDADSDLRSILHFIEALTPADATAALADIRRAAKAEGVREAARHARAHSDDRGGADRPFEWHDGYQDGCRGAEAAILARAAEIEKENANG